MTTAYEIVKKLLEANECLRIAYDKGLDRNPAYLTDIVRLKYDMLSACNWLDSATGLNSNTSELYDFYIRRLDLYTVDASKVDNYVKEEFNVK